MAATGGPTSLTAALWESARAFRHVLYQFPASAAVALDGAAAALAGDEELGVVERRAVSQPVLGLKPRASLWCGPHRDI